jgi:signal transduction histidine kinase/ActR/RegA family two-component response regulator
VTGGGAPRCARLVPLRAVPGTRLPFASLRVRLLALVLVALLPALGLVLFAVGAQRRLLEDEARGGVNRLAELAAERVQRPMDGALGLVLGMTSMPWVQRPDPSCSLALAPLLAHNPTLLNAGAVLPDGTLFCSAAPPSGPVNLADRRFFDMARASRGLGVGELVLSRVRGAGSIGFGQAVLGEDGALRAVAFASLDVRHLQRELDDLHVAPGAEVTLMDRRRVILAARGRSGQMGQPLGAGELDALWESAGPLELEGPDGARFLYALHRVLTPSGEVVFQVVAGLPVATVLGPVDDIILRTLLGFAAAAALVLLAAALVAERGVLRKVEALTAASRRLAAGDATARVGLRAGSGELGDLIRSFDAMAAALQAHQADRERLEGQLRHSQKLEAVGQLAGGVAHDFNNLLTAIITCARLIEQDLPEGHPSRADAVEILEAGGRAGSLTRQLLAFSRRQQLAPEVLEVAATVRELTRMLRRLLGERVELVVICRAPGTVLADPGQLEQVIVNLAVNARDAMPRGGRLTIEVAEVAPEALEVGDQGLPPGPLVVISVRDSGSGMTEEVQRRIFEPFFTTKEEGRGTGLGLSTVYGIVAQSGGAIRVRSAPGQGAEFRVYLPRHAGLPEPAAARPAAAGGGREVVLVVEDDEVLRQLARRVLTAASYVVLDAPGAEQALALLGRHGGTIDLLLTDVVMPGEGGPRLAQRLGQAHPGLRVLFMSGYAPELGDYAVPAGATFLAKPFPPEELLAAVRRVLDAPPPPAAAREVEAGASI